MQQHPKISFGTYRLRGEACVAAVQAALECGYTSIDTARCYKNEREVGVAIKSFADKKRREDLYITSKIAPGEQGYDACWQAIATSLRELDTYYLDLVLIHWPGKAKTAPTSMENKEARRGSWRALMRAKRQGLVRNIGVSNFTIDHLGDISLVVEEEEDDDEEEEDGEAEGRRGVKEPQVPFVNQCECHPLCAQVELRAYCASKGITFQAYSSLGSGDERVTKNADFLKFSHECGLSVEQLLLLWAVRKGISVIPKSSSRERIFANFVTCSTTFPIDKDELASSSSSSSSSSIESILDQMDALDEDLHTCWDSRHVV